jgi:hypothetical protein
MRALSVLFLSALLFAACSEEKEKVLDPLAIENKSSADLPKGGIPYEITWFTDLQQKGQTIGNKINFLRDYKLMYSDEDYYSNLFQISIMYLNLEKDLNNATDEDVKFLLDEFAVVDSNIASLKNIPVLLNEAFKRQLMSQDEIVEYSQLIFDKNLKVINGMQWGDDEMRKEKIEELKNTKFNSEYYRGRVYTNLSKFN